MRATAEPHHDLARSKIGASEAEQRAIKDAFAPLLAPEVKKEVPTFSEWFKGRFWREWVIGRRNKPTEVKSKNTIYEGYLKEAFGDRRLDEIGTAKVAAFRASLVEKGLGGKSINNILGVLSKPMKYAVDCEVIVKSPRIGLFKVERPRSCRGTSSSTLVSSRRRRSKAPTGTPPCVSQEKRGSVPARSKRCAGAKTST